MARGSVRKRGSTWTVVLDVGPDPVTGRRRQKSKGGYRTRKVAEAALRELSAAVDARRYVERSTTTVGEYLDLQRILHVLGEELLIGIERRVSDGDVEREVAPAPSRLTA